MIFRNWVLENFPFIEDDFDALTDYELFCKMLDYVRKVHIDNERFINQITVKLEQMYNEGKFDSLIEEIVNLQALFIFNTVSDMKSATNLVNGSHAKTLGYNTINDGGESSYLIRTKTNDDVVDDIFIVSLSDNDLVAELLVKDRLINVKQGGVTGTVNNDNTNLLEIIFDKGYDMYFPSGTYNINKRLTFKSHKLLGDSKGNTIIKLNSDLNSELLYSDDLTDVEINNIKFDLGEYTDSLKTNINLFNTNGLKIYNCEFDGGYGSQVRINGSNDVDVYNCYFHNIGGDDTNPGEGIYMNGGSNLTFRKCKSDYIRDHILYLDGSNPINNVLVENCYIKRSGHEMVTENGAGIAVYGGCKNIFIKDNIFDSCRNGLNIAVRNSILPQNIFISNNHIFDSQQDGIYAEANGLYIDNNVINDNSYNGLDLRNGLNFHISNTSCYNNTVTGINIRNGENIVIDNSICYDNASSGITIGYNESNICEHVKISNCLAYATESESQLTGIQILNSDDVTITTSKSYGHTVNWDTQRSVSLNLVSQLNSDRETSINSLMYRSSIPNSGTYNKGDTILYTSPSAGGKIGAVCTTAGAPGTWKEFGAIES